VCPRGIDILVLARLSYSDITLLAQESRSRSAATRLTNLKAGS